MKRICKECQSEFNSDRAGKKYCSHKCSRDYGTRLWRERNKGRYQEKSRQWYRDNKEKAKADHARWARENPDKIREHSRRWASKNKAKMTAYQAKWRQANPEKAKAVCSRRRARKRANGVEDTAEFRERMTAVGTRQACFYCGVDCTEGYHWDHFVPISGGGPDAEWNLRVSCPGCNQRKHARLPESVFCEEMGL